MVEETFVAHTPKEAYDLAKEKYGSLDFELIKAEQVKDLDGTLVSKITIAVSEEDFKSAMGLSEEEELVREIGDLKSKIEIMKDAIMSNSAVDDSSDKEESSIETEASDCGCDEDVLLDCYPLIPPPDAVCDDQEMLDANTLESELLREKNNHADEDSIVDSFPHTTVSSVCAVDAAVDLMVKNGISESWLNDALSDTVSVDMEPDEQELLDSIIGKMHSSLEIYAEDISKPFFMMLVGSTGVGKTTTIAKLAARYALLMDEPLKVGLINLDSFRIGAHEQLDKYAKMMQLDHIKVTDADEFGDLLKDMSSYDVVLIDTAGISPYDTSRLLGTIEFLKKSEECHVQTHLVIAATAKKDDIFNTYEHFSFLNIQNVILTKFDETKKIGEILSFLLENDVAVSYISSGQNVPDDLEIASKSALIDRFLGDLDV